MASYGPSLLQDWHDGPINSPINSPRAMALSARPYMALDSPRSTMSSRPDQLKELYLSSALARQAEGGGARFWDSFVAKQNSRAMDTLAQYTGGGTMSPRSPRSMLSPRSMSPRSARAGGTSPRLMPGKSLVESMGINLPPLSARDPLPKDPYRERLYKHYTLQDAIRPGGLRGSMDPAMERRLREQERRKAQLSKLERRIIHDTQNSLSARFGDMLTAFRDVDVDASGKISKEEMMRALQSWGVTADNANVVEEAAAIIKMCDVDGDGSITYDEFVTGLANYEMMKASQPKPKERTHRDLKGDPLRDPLSKLKPGVTADELVACHTQVRERLLNKHDTIHKAFKFMDADGSGYVNRGEFESALRKLNIAVRKPVLDSLLDIIDAEDNDDGGDDHDIGFKEFARVMTAADVFKMAAMSPRPAHVDPIAAEREKVRKEALKHLRPGVTQEELRKFQEQVKSKISAKYGKHAFTSAFKWIDSDRTGSITREEFKEAMRVLNLAGVKEAILDTLCDFIDASGDGGFGYREFARVLTADDVMQMAPGMSVV